VLAHHHIRPLKTDDGPLLDRVMDGMSLQSRYQRYHVPKPHLTKRERDYLTAVDGRDHLALVAISPYGTPLGVARAVRLREDREAAELAVEVIDARHRQGLGTELTTRLAERAGAVGIRRLVARVLAGSVLAGGLRRRGWRLVERDGPVVVYELS
jgi:GNAT superfamily N-acetyltransferase